LYRLVAVRPPRNRFKWAGTDFAWSLAGDPTTFITFEWRTAVLPHEKTGRPTRLSGHWLDRIDGFRRGPPARCYHGAPRRPSASGASPPC